MKRFWSKVDKSESTECWLWMGCETSNGYGQFRFKGKAQPAHRVSYMLTHDCEIPSNVFVCHVCDVRLCVRPDHLFLGSHVDNMKDMVSKDRQCKGQIHSRGEKCGTAKLTTDQVLEIRKLRKDGWLLREIASRFGMGTSMISYITRGTWWKHI